THSISHHSYSVAPARDSMPLAKSRGVLLDRAIDFAIDLEPGTKPISIPSYPMAPTELTKLKD
ncbi:hypothetical protein MTR67_003405, partial [Solanum verrucosum]